MGADLIGYMAFGPNSISEDTIEACKAKAVAAIEFLHKAMDEDHNVVPGIDQDEWDKHFGDLDAYDLDNLCYTVHDMMDGPGVTAEHVVDNYLEQLSAWPHLGRDSVCRNIDENRVAVFAGERTWGDTPEGDGYTLLNFLYVLGLGEILGIDI